MKIAEGPRPALQPLTGCWVTLHSPEYQKTKTLLATRPRPGGGIRPDSGLPRNPTESTPRSIRGRIKGFRFKQQWFALTADFETFKSNSLNSGHGNKRTQPTARAEDQRPRCSHTP
jgi:hypothetical protein